MSTTMEVFRTEQYYIFLKGEHSLWWDRFTGSFYPKPGYELVKAGDPICIGLCQGVIGKVYHQELFEPRLVIIKESIPVGQYFGSHVIYKISSVALIKIGSENADLNLTECMKHRSNDSDMKQEIMKNPFTKTWGSIKSAGTSIRNTSQHCVVIASNQVKASMKRTDIKEKEKFDKRIQDEIFRIFTGTDSFFFCHTFDITNSLQRLSQLQNEGQFDVKCIWKTVDRRFFWNKNMLKDLINLDDPLADPWILPIIQGYVQIELCKLDFGDIAEITEPVILSLISRRSRYRAGTRYKRRGVDEKGNCANYVETEQIVSFKQHYVSFVQVRGSVPVYWSQPGFKYRPPPVLERTEEEAHEAFKVHFRNELQMYGPVCIVNLVDQLGKERVIFDAYTQHVLLFDNPSVTYTTFDFHEYCRGMHFENVSILINSLSHVLKEMGYFWRDKEGTICSQNGVFRVNCIDCLDRTNVVETALGKAMLEIQLTKLGLLPPDKSLPNDLKAKFQLLWANNGDIISKQYAGTNALKGDFTRTGERRLAGIMKDGMNSANRYYKVHFTDNVRQCCIDIIQGNPSIALDSWNDSKTFENIFNELIPLNPPSYTPQIALGMEFDLANAIYEGSRYYLSHFKDTHRQGTIDLILGKNVSQETFSDTRIPGAEEDYAATAIHMKQLIEDCKKMFLSDPEAALGAWGLIDASPSTGDLSETEMDTVLVLTRNSYYVADYDNQTDRVMQFQRVFLRDVVSLECGYVDSGLSLFKREHFFCVRINYKMEGADGYCHMFRSTNIRFFNNVATVIKTIEEEIESLTAICEAFLVAIDVAGLKPVPCLKPFKLDRKKSKTTIKGASTVYLDISNLPQITRNVSENQLNALKNAGTKALSNVSEQFSKLNKISQSIQNKSMFSIGLMSPKPTDSSSGESDETDDDDLDVNVYQPKHTEPINCVDCDNETCMSTKDAYLPAVGIVMQKRPPSILVNNSAGEAMSIPVNRKYSHSSEEMQQQSSQLSACNDLWTGRRANSEQDISLTISQSKSESVLKQNKSAVSASSPVTKVFTPFTKLAKNISANLDPRKMSKSSGTTQSVREFSDNSKLIEMFKGRKTKVIAI